MLVSRAKIAALIGLAIGTIGTVASIAALHGPLKTLLGAIFLVVFAGAGGVFLALAITSSTRAISQRPSSTLDSELGNAEEVWFSWHTGSVKLAQGDLFRRPRRVRLVLTHPESSTLLELAKVCNLTAEKMAEDIRHLTVAVRKGGGAVSWFNGPIGNSLIIADPNKPTGWARIEVLIPFGDPVL